MSPISLNIADRLRRSAELVPHQRAIVFPESRDPAGRAAWTHLTFAELDQDADAIARGLMSLGVRKGHRIVLFNKQERISGDLSDIQSIDLKVRHQPSFSVYMKWQNGDKGRQLLYNEDYEDKKMVVKLGGLKGRILPGIKLDPHGPEAMAAARYPVTEAGILGMVKQIIVHRQNDLKHGQGVTCVRLPNQVFDERDCYCFRYEYHLPEFNRQYRKSTILIDSRYHIPLNVINHTWAKEAEGLTAEQLDELTLIENYSFSRVDFGRELVAEEFSRENKAYRM